MISSQRNGQDWEGTGRGHFDVSWNLTERLTKTTEILSPDRQYSIWSMISVQWFSCKRLTCDIRVDAEVCPMFVMEMA